MAVFDLTGVEVHGQDILSFMDALGTFGSIGDKIIQDLQVGTRTENKFQIVPSEWYPLADKIRVLQEVKLRVGGQTLRRVGEKIPENARFPAHINDIHSAISAIDIAYHMNHRKDGQLMFNDMTGTMTDGIGHYGYEAVPGKREIISVCDSPNLSEYDEGIVLAMARRFQPTAKVTLDTQRPSRRDGGSSCTFILTW